MDVGMVLSAAQALFAALRCKELREISSCLRYQSELDNLERTVKTVKAVLLDAEAMGDEELSCEAQLFIDELKDAVYDADDLVDEFVTLVEQNHNKLLMEGVINVPEKVHRFFSRIRDLPFAYRMSQGVKGIRKKLDAIADNHRKFGYKFDSQPICKRREETCSYVYSQDVIGRDEDKEKIVGMLLDPTVRRDVSFLTIVGMGGLGKTTLAQLIFSDERITKEFTIRIWVCVGDHEDRKHLNVKAVLAKILESITDCKHDDCSLESLQRKVRGHLVEKKYLLILDDIWNENRDDWLGLENFLKGGPSGSWVVVTTRSSNTAAIVGDGSSYDLQGLSDEDSWRLFERVAFGQESPQDLVQIGQMVVRKCVNVPLAIRVAGSLLYGRGKDKWLSFEKNGLAAINPEKNCILPILKFSYHHLESPLKSCFTYCALFPKDHKIEKEKLISLWMAQGYVVPLVGGQSIEDAGEEYFTILLRRCFFQNVEKDKDGKIISCKIHDLMHDVAQQVAGKEVCVVDCVSSDMDKRIQHLSVGGRTGIEQCLTKNKIRTLLHDYKSKQKVFVVDTVSENCMSLRALSLRAMGITRLPNTIGKVLHLRYLDLSCNKRLEKLPHSFTKLHNLETLILKNCTQLRELPRDIGKLVKLRCLDITGCGKLIHMPASIGKLSCLHKLPMFVLSLSNSSCSLAELEGLRALTQLKGNIWIKIMSFEDATYVKEDRSAGGYLINKQHLNRIVFTFMGDDEQDYQEALMENMWPHPNLTHLELYEYKGGRMPSWGREHNLPTSLQNLVTIMLSGCDGLKYLSGMGKLHHLRSLTLISLKSLEYMEESRNSSEGGAWATSDSRGEVEECLFFPSLKALKLLYLPRLKGWWRGVGVEDDDSNNNSLPRRPSLCFLHLSRLEIKGYPELISIPSFPNVEQLSSRGDNERLRRIGACVNEKGSPFLEMATDNMRYLKSMLSVKSLQQCLTKLEIEDDNKVERLQEVEEVWQSCCSSSLRSLSIKGCSNLRSVVKGGLEHLTALEELEICNCPNLTLTQEGDEDLSHAHPPFPQSLHSLDLTYLPKLVNLPEGMQHLTSLQSLCISSCEALEPLPEWTQHLTSLTHLKIFT